MTKNNDMVKRFEEILRGIEEDDKNKMDIELGMSELVMTNDGKLVRKGRESKGGLDLSDYAMTQAFNRLGIPVRYGKRLMEERPELVADQFNHWASKEKDKGVLIRLRNLGYGQGYIRGFLSDRYSKLDNKDVMTSLHEIIKQMPQTEIQGFHIDDRRTHIRLTLPELSAEVGKAVNGERDILRVGVDLVNSEIGASSLVISPLVFRLVCTNGLRAWTTDGEQFRQRHIHLSHQELFGRMNSAVVESIKQGDQLVHRMNETQKFEVENPLDVIEELTKKAMYSQKLTDTVKENYALEPDKNLYGVINAFTRTARDMENEQRLDLEKFAGEIMFDNRLMKQLQLA